jgi:hypothetical protein
MDARIIGTIATNSHIHDTNISQYTITIIILCTVGILMKHKLIGYALAMVTVVVFYIVPITSGWNVLTGLVCLLAGIHYYYEGENLMATVLMLISLMLI